MAPIRMCTIELRTIFMYLEVKHTQTEMQTHSLMNNPICHYSKIHEQSIPLSHYNVPIMHIHGIATLISEIYLKMKWFRVHIAHFCPMNNSIVIVKYSQHANTFQLSILFSAVLYGNAHMAYKIHAFSFLYLDGRSDKIYFKNGYSNAPFLNLYAK